MEMHSKKTCAWIKSAGMRFVGVLPDPETILLPSGLHATDLTALLCLFKVGSTVLQFQSQTAMVLPFVHKVIVDYFNNKECI